MRLKKSVIFVLLFLTASRLFAQAPNISGEYEGSADVEGMGKLTLKAEIRQNGDKFSGVLVTPLGDLPILEGSYKDGNLLLKIDAGGDDVFLNGKADQNGEFAGEVSGSTAKGTFKLKRVGDAAPESENAVNINQSKEKWREDLRFLAAELPKKHKNAFHRISREQFEKMIADLDAKIPFLSNEEIVFGMARIVAQIGDGHTGLGWSWLFPQVPVRFFWFGRQLRVVQVSKEFPRLNGARLMKIGGVPIEKIYEQSRDYIPQGESEQFVLNSSQYLFTYPFFLKIIDAARENDKAVYEFIDLKGKRFSVELKALPRSEKFEWIAPFKQTPLYLRKPDEPFYFEYLKDAKTIYVNFRWYPRRPEFKKFSEELFDFIDKNEVEKLVFDLRQNGGGDFTRGRDFFIKPLRERKQFLERGRLFVLAGRVTFSAGMSNTADFRNDLNAFVVGEPTGARPIGYMEMRGASLPNSHLYFSYSIELYKFSANDTPGIMPDKTIAPDWKSFLAGRDEALEWVLAYPKTK